MQLTVHVVVSVTVELSKATALYFSNDKCNGKFKQSFGRLKDDHDQCE